MDNRGSCLEPLSFETDFDYMTIVHGIACLENISLYEAFLRWCAYTVPVWHIRSGLVEKDTSYHINVFFEQELKLGRNNNV